MFKLLVLLMLVVVARPTAHADPIPTQDGVAPSPGASVNERPLAGPCPAGPDRIGEPTAPPTTLPGWPTRLPNGPWPRPLPCPAGPQLPPSAAPVPVQTPAPAIPLGHGR
jgi:hypothetical protein